MTEHEKIFEGKMVSPRSEELRAVKHKAHNLCTEYNMLTEDNPRRAEIIHEMLGSHGEGVNFQGPDVYKRQFRGYVCASKPCTKKHIFKASAKT